MELLHDLLHIREPCLCSDLLECLLNLSSTRHILVHLRFEEGSPKLLSEEVFVHFSLILVLVVICSLVSDVLLSSVTLDTPL